MHSVASAMVGYTEKTSDVRPVKVPEPCWRIEGKAPFMRFQTVPCMSEAGLPTEAKQREQWPIYDYQYGYFPDAYMEEVRVAWVGNQQHNPGERMHWARDKSSDHMNKAMRHIDDYARGTRKDVDGTYHLAKAIWRLKARLQLDLEEERAAVARQEEARGHADAAPYMVRPGKITLRDDPEGFL